MEGDTGGLETGEDDGAEVAGGVGLRAGGGATATGAGLCRHPVTMAMAVLTRITCGSAPSNWWRNDTLAHSGAVAVVELFSQFAQPVRGSVQGLRGVLP